MSHRPALSEFAWVLNGLGDFEWDEWLEVVHGEFGLVRFDDCRLYAAQLVRDTAFRVPGDGMPRATFQPSDRLLGLVHVCFGLDDYQCRYYAEHLFRHMHRYLAGIPPCPPPAQSNWVATVPLVTPEQQQRLVDVALCGCGSWFCVLATTIRKALLEPEQKHGCTVMLRAATTEPDERAAQAAISDVLRCFPVLCEHRPRVLVTPMPSDSTPVFKVEISITPAQLPTPCGAA